ncbi:hypothetical protein ACFP3I_11480 [Chryseobacterium arachidis]
MSYSLFYGKIRFLEHSLNHFAQKTNPDDAGFVIINKKSNNV